MSLFSQVKDLEKTTSILKRKVQGITCNLVGMSLTNGAPVGPPINATQSVKIDLATGIVYYWNGTVWDISGRVEFERVANYSALPAANLHTDEYYHVEGSQGTSWLPWSLGGTYYPKGFYYSNGVSWVYAGEMPYQATQGDVDAGIIADQFVTPITLKNATQWATKANASHTHVEADLVLSDITTNDVSTLKHGLMPKLPGGPTVYYNGDGSFTTPSVGVDDHGVLTGLSEDDHSQYPLLVGRSGGQTLIGGTGSTDDLVLRTTSGIGATGADMKFQVGSNGTTEAMTILNSGNTGVGQTNPVAKFVVNGVAFFGGINELVDPYSTYSAQSNGYIQIGKGIPVANANQFFPDINFIHDLTSVTGDRIAGGFKFVNKSTGSATEKRLAQFFCWAENAVNKGAMSFYTNDGTNVLSERLRIASDGKIGMGVATSLGARLSISDTAQQLRVMYDASNYCSTTVSSTGQTTFDAVGTGARFIFSDRVNIPTSTPASAAATGTTGDIAWDTNYIYVCTATNTWKRTAITTW